MGYTTEFKGGFTFNKPVEKELKEYINVFSRTRHMQRDVSKLKEVFPNWAELGYKGKLGYEGEYFVGGKGFLKQDHDASIIDYNQQPETCPGLWCQWVINDNDELVWDQGEKFYAYARWLRYLIFNFFAPEGYILNGEVEFQGEDFDDKGILSIKNNIVYFL